MKNKYVFYLISCALALIHPLHAQQTKTFSIKGIIADSSSKKAIEYTTISILDEQEKVIALTYSDENGVFKSSDVSTGSYFLNLSLIGYSQKRLPFTISNEKPVFDFGKILLSANVNELQTVTVTGTRQLVEQQPGMLIYNAEKDISNQGGTAADVLRKAPILNVDASGKVSMRGNSNLRILINGKYSGQMARSPADALNMMPANSIKSIEVITSPSARYDAEGAAGVINIITKKGNKSVSGTLELVGGNLEQAFNPRLSVNRDKWNINTAFHVHKFKDIEKSSLNRSLHGSDTETGSVLQETSRNNAYPHGSGDVQIEFAPDSANVFNFSVNGSLGKWPQNSEQFTRKYDANGLLIDSYRQRVRTQAPMKGIDLNLGYTKKFKRKGEELYLMAQRNSEVYDFDYNSLQSNTELLPTYREINNNHTANHEWTFQSDYVVPLVASGKHALESGLKAILRDGDSNYDVFESVDSNVDKTQPVPERSDRFNFKQNVFAAYSQAKFKWSSGWALHAGARLEGTYLEGQQTSLGSSFKNDFWNFVPSATLFKKLDNHNNLTLSYTKRISRPSIWDLNPNTDRRDPNNIVVGNPTLRPEEVNQTEFTYALQTDKDLFINLSLFARSTKNSMESITSVLEGGVAMTSTQNLASNHQFGINGSASVGITKNWKLNGNANARYNKFKSDGLGILNDGMAWGLNLNSSWKLPKNFSVQCYGVYDGQSITLQGNESYWIYYSFAAKKEFPSKKLSINLTTVSPFNSYLSRKEVIRASSFTTNMNNQYGLRSIRVSLTWEFGGQIKSSESRKINNDDQKNAKSGG